MKRPTLTYLPKGLVLTDDEFHNLHKRINSTRSTSRSVTVDMEALKHLLSDHAALYARIEDVDRTLRAGNGGSKPHEAPRPVDAEVPTPGRRARAAAALDDDDEDLIG